MKRHLVQLFVLCVLCAVVIPTAAQQTGNYQFYAWDAADLTLIYPVDWEAPLPAESDGQLVLQMAQALVDSPDTRPPAIPFITLTLILPDTENPNVDLNTLLASRLRDLDVKAAGTRTATVLDSPALVVDGASTDGLLFGMGQAALLTDDSILLIVGRGLAEQQATFEQTFNAVAGSLVYGANAAPILPEYGARWFTQRTLADGPDAFVSLVALTDGPQDTLYVLDRFLGVVQLDAQMGTVLGHIPFDDNLQYPTDIAVDGDGRVYVGDTACNCVERLSTTTGRWLIVADEFDVEAPFSIAAALDGTLYMTDLVNELPVVRVLDGGTESEIALSEEVIAQPLLAVDRGDRLLAITGDGFVFRLADGAFELAYELSEIPQLMLDAAVDPYNNLVVMTADEGVIVYNADGDVIDNIGQAVDDIPLPGQLFRPVGAVVGLDGTLYWADSDDTYGAVTAMSTGIESGRVGASHLVPNIPVQGILDPDASSQSWTFDGVAGEQISIYAVDTSQTTFLNVAVRLIAPDGREEAYNDDQEGEELYNPLDAVIAGHKLARTGCYTVVVERVEGDGMYSLALAQDRVFDLNPDTDTVLEGELYEVLPKDRWSFQGRAGQIVTITMNAQSGTLDPYLRLLDINGNLAAENDDALDSTLGPDAQLAEVRLSYTGKFVIEATRFDGEGRYELTISVVD